MARDGSSESEIVATGIGIVCGVDVAGDRPVWLGGSEVDGTTAPVHAVGGSQVKCAASWNDAFVALSGACAES